MNPESSDHSKQSTQIVFEWMLAAIIIVASVVVASTLSFEDSEIWGITSSRRFLSGFTFWNSAWLKPLFSAMMWGATSLVNVDPTSSNSGYNSDWYALVVARTVGAIFAISCLFSVRRLLSSKQTWLFVTALATPLVITNFPKARSDMMTAAIALLALEAITSTSYRWTTKATVYVVSCIAMLLTTPKAVDLCLVLGVGLWLASGEGRPKAGRALLWLGYPFTLFLAAVLFVSPLTLGKAADYAFRSYGEIPMTTQDHWAHLKSLFVHSPVAVFVLAGGFFFLARLFRHLDRRQKTLAFAGIITLVGTLLHAQKLPFFLASRLPFWLIGAGAGWALADVHAQASVRIFKRLKLQIAMPLAALATCGYALLQSPTALFLQPIQRGTYQELERFLVRSRVDSYWDAIGLFPHRNNLFHYPSPGDSTNPEILEAVEKAQPELVLKTLKMNLLEPELSTWLNQKYLSISDSVFIRKITLSQCESTVHSVMQRAAAEGMRPPLALTLRAEEVPGKKNFAWLRVPFEFTNGAVGDSINESNFWSFKLANCDGTYAITELGPWLALPAPEFKSLFGYLSLP